jgi:hypothetical protein
MQITDLSLISPILTAGVAFLVALYLYQLWHRQPTRMFTDLPLMFSLSFVGTAANMTASAIPLLLQMEETFTMFRVRSLFICLSVIPMLGITLSIWIPRLAKWHPRIMAGIVVYWTLVALFGPTVELIMIMTVPILLVFTVVLMATFTITWRTGRLKEVRSDLLVVSLLMAFLSQALRVTFMNAGLSVVGDVFNLIMILGIGIALVNPWYRPETSKKREIAEPLAY